MVSVIHGAIVHLTMSHQGTYWQTMVTSTVAAVAVWELSLLRPAIKLEFPGGVSPVFSSAVKAAEFLFPVDDFNSINLDDEVFGQVRWSSL